MRDAMDVSPTKLLFRDINALDTDVRAIVRLMHPAFDFTHYARAFADVVRLFIGDYPGYRACNTAYHDLTHTLAVLLATARLLHGTSVARAPFSARTVCLALTAALLHDVGYIQSEEETEGTGARYTLTHVTRSIDFLRGYFACHGRSAQAAEDAAAMIRCTDLAVPMADIAFATGEVRLAGCVLGSADLLAQMADEIYIEKLSSLFEEFHEAGIPGYETELDLFQATHAFNHAMQGRLAGPLEGVAPHMLDHFRTRWGTERDLYQENINKNLNFLAKSLVELGPDCKTVFRRRRDRRPPFI